MGGLHEAEPRQVPGARRAGTSRPRWRDRQGAANKGQARRADALEAADEHAWRRRVSVEQRNWLHALRLCLLCAAHDMEPTPLFGLHSGHWPRPAKLCMLSVVCIEREGHVLLARCSSARTSPSFYETY